MGSLSNLYISQSYQSLIHLATNNTASATLIDLQDGLGNSIGVSVNTGGDLSLSGSLTASLAKGYVWVGNGNDRTILVATSSFFTSGSGPTDITSLNAFTASQLNINAGYNQYTSSTNSRLNNIEAATSSYVTESETGSFVTNIANNPLTPLTFTYNQPTFGSTNVTIDLPADVISSSAQITSLGFVSSSITASSLVTASVNLNTITFTKGDASTFNITVNTGSGGGGTTDISSLNAFTASQETKDTTLASVTSSLNSATASLFTSASLALVTASVNNDDITFTKGDGSQFTIQVATGSFAVSASYAETASLATNALDIIVNVKNTTGAQINKGTVVRIIGATGDNPLIGTASWTNDANSANTLGFVVANIPNDSFGTVMTQGTLLSVNTDPALGYTAGQLVYLSGSGQYTNVKPPAPFHEVRLGQVLRAQQNNGSIYVLVQNGYELDELHDVDINTGSLANNDLLAYNSTTLQWENKTVTQVGATTTSSFNSYTSSTNSRLNNIEAATSSYVTSAITASSLVTASVSLNTITFTKGDASTFNITVDTGSGGGSAISVQDEGSILGNATSFNFNGAGVTATLTAGTASITIPGGGGSIDTGSFATTGSNTFTGDQTLIDAAGNFFTITDTSGSMMLVAKSYTSASAHLSSSVPSPSGSQLNLIFKNNNNTADTIISGSNNIFVNPAAPTAGFKRYVGTTGNIILNASNVPQISGSMQFSPTMNNNYFGGNGTTLTMRGPVSSSAWAINANNIVGIINVGNGAVLNAEKIVSGLTMTGNNVVGTLNIVANRNSLTSIMQVNSNTINGTVTLTAASSSIIAFSNNIVADNNFNFTNNYYSGSVGASGPQANRNFIIGASNTFLMTGFADAGGSVNYVNNVIGGGSNTIFVNATSASTSAQFYNNIVYGNTLIVSASSNSTTTNGSAFFGRYGVNDGVRNRTAGTIFSVGTGTAAGSRKTGFLIDSGSNTFVEGTFNVSGSSAFNGNVNITGSLLVNGATISTVGFATTGSNSFNGNQRITGSLTMSGSIITVDRSGNDGNVYMGLNALGMGNAGAQPLAVGNSISVAIGIGAMRFASGSNQNVAIGNNALLITSGSKNFAMGSEAMSANTLGSTNVAIGTSALQNNTTGDSSTAIGDSAAQFASGSQNTFIGQYSGYNVTGSNNVIIGSYRGVAGEKIDNNIILSDGQQNIKAQYSGSAWAFQDNIKFNKGTNKTTDIVSVNGSATVNNSLVTAASIILVTTQNSGTGPVYPAVVLNKGTGTFDIAHNFGSALDVAYMIINPT